MCYRTALGVCEQPRLVTIILSSIVVHIQSPDISDLNIMTSLLTSVPMTASHQAGQKCRVICGVNARLTASSHLLCVWLRCAKMLRHVWFEYSNCPLHLRRERRRRERATRRSMRLSIILNPCRLTIIKVDYENSLLRLIFIFPSSYCSRL